MGACSEWHSLTGDRLLSDSLEPPGSRLQDRDLFLFATRFGKASISSHLCCTLLEQFRREKERI